MAQDIALTPVAHHSPVKGERNVMGSTVDRRLFYSDSTMRLLGHQIPHLQIRPPLQYKILHPHMEMYFYLLYTEAKKIRHIFFQLYLNWQHISTSFQNIERMFSSFSMLSAFELSTCSRVDTLFMCQKKKHILSGKIRD